MHQFLKFKLDQVLFWIATIAFHMYTRSELIDRAGIGVFALEVFIRNGLLAIVVYTNLLVLIPRFARNDRWLTYLLFLVGILGFYVMVKNAHDVYLYRQVLNEPKGYFDNSFYNLSIAIFYLAFATALQLSREWLQQRDLIRKIEIEKLNTELAYLKAQMNPHFLFNSLNTIHFQIDKSNSTARETLTSFSEMLRYQLYECNGNLVPVEKELKYIKNYIDLQRLRKDDKYNIRFSAPDLRGFEIAPLLLIPFVENAFKYVSHALPANSIDIRLEKHNNKLMFQVTNTCDPGGESNANPTGIGLKNVARRLELLYTNRHTLELARSNGTFQVRLELIVDQ